MAAGTLNITIEQGATFERNFYLGIGYRMPIASFSDAGGGLVKVTCTGVTGLSNGDKIVIQESDYYSGTHSVTVVTANSFTFPAVWEVTEPDTYWAHPRIITGFTAESHIRQNYSDDDPLAEFACSIEDDLGGHVKIELSADTTRALPRLRRAYWDLELTETATSFVERILQGKVVVTPEVTK